jgi:hypothetical protein
MRLQDAGRRTCSLKGVGVHAWVVGAVLLLTTPAAAQETIYFADIFYPSFSNGYVRKVGTDGAGLQTLVNVGGGLRGVAVDRFAGRIYWTDVDGDVIRRANLNGSGAVDLLTAGLSFPMAIELDLLNGKLYWGDQSLGQIGSADLDGSNAAPLLSTNFASGLAVDVVNSKIYWSSASDLPPWNEGEIRRANLDGSEIETVVTGAGKPADIALDVTGGRVYWTDYTFDVVRRAHLDGSGVEDLFVVGENLNPGGIALDLSAGKVYWGQDVSTPPYVGKIMRMNLDGSNPEDVALNLGMVTDLVLSARLPGDVNDDGDVDLDDYHAWVDCLTGPGIPTTAGCEPADLQADDDVDLADFSTFQRVFRGS